MKGVLPCQPYPSRKKANIRRARGSNEWKLRSRTDVWGPRVSHAPAVRPKFYWKARITRVYLAVYVFRGKISRYSTSQDEDGAAQCMCIRRARRIFFPADIR